MTKHTETWEQLSVDPVLKTLAECQGTTKRLASEAGVKISRFPVLEDADWLDRVRNRASSTLTMMVIGQVSSGKSSFINSLLGRRLLVPSDKPTDGVISILNPLVGQEEEHAEKISKDGTLTRLSLEDGLRFLRQQDTSASEHFACSEVRLYVKDPWLRRLRIINTPGLGDKLRQYEETTLRYLKQEETDLIVWTFNAHSAGNEHELAIFGKALYERRNSIIGVVTQCLQGHESNHEYIPSEQEDLQTVAAHLQEQLGEYLTNVIFYDSHVACRLLGNLRVGKQGESDGEDLKRCGYTDFADLMDRLVGRDGERVESARLELLLGRCSSNATALAEACSEAEELFRRKVRATEEEIAAWEHLEKEIVTPTKAAMRNALHELAQDRAREMTRIMGNEAADCIGAEFSLLGALSRGILSKVRIMDPAGERLNRLINESVEGGLERHEFHARLNRKAQAIVVEHLEELVRVLSQKTGFVAGKQGDVEVTKAHPGNPVGDPTELVGRALAAALEGVVSKSLKIMAEKMEEKAAQLAAEQAAKKAVQKATQQLTEQAAEAAAKKGGKWALGAGAAKLLSAVSLALVPFDIYKLYKDFAEGKSHLQATIRARYEADTFIYENNISDQLFQHADYVFGVVVSEARATSQAKSEEAGNIMRCFQEAQDTHQTLDRIAKTLAERAKHVQ